MFHSLAFLVITLQLGPLNRLEGCLRNKQSTKLVEQVGLYIPTNTKHLYKIYTILDQRRKRWADVV